MQSGFVYLNEFEAESHEIRGENALRENSGHNYLSLRIVWRRSYVKVFF